MADEIITPFNVAQSWQNSVFLHFGDRQTDTTDALSRSRCHEWQLSNIYVMMCLLWVFTVTDQCYTVCGCRQWIWFVQNYITDYWWTVQHYHHQYVVFVHIEWCCHMGKMCRCRLYHWMKTQLTLCHGTHLIIHTQQLRSCGFQTVYVYSRSCAFTLRYTFVYTLYLLVSFCVLLSHALCCRKVYFRTCWLQVVIICVYGV